MGMEALVRPPRCGVSPLAPSLCDAFMALLNAVTSAYQRRVGELPARNGWQARRRRHASRIDATVYVKATQVKVAILSVYASNGTSTSSAATSVRPGVSITWPEKAVLVVPPPAPVPMVVDTPDDEPEAAIPSQPVYSVKAETSALASNRGREQVHAQLEARDTEIAALRARLADAEASGNVETSEATLQRTPLSPEVAPTLAGLTPPCVAVSPAVQKPAEPSKDERLAEAAPALSAMGTASSSTMSDAHASVQAATVETTPRETAGTIATVSASKAEAPLRDTTLAESVTPLELFPDGDGSEASELPELCMDSPSEDGG